MPSDGNPSFYHLWAVMDFHPTSLVMDIHAPSRLMTYDILEDPSDYAYCNIGVGSGGEGGDAPPQ